MKQKLGTLLEEKVMRLAKRRAAEEGRPLNELIEDALVQYLAGKRPPTREREMAYHTFCERPLRLTSGQFRQVLEEDIWDR
ncbi:MAG: hypothetical protein OEY91_13455 [Nitrospirota bacterium]|nr:hypothetical protein [Nitrospirota bacterium]